MRFDDDIRVRAAGEGAWTGRIDPGYNIGANPNGGYLLAVAASAMREALPAQPDALSVTAHYLKPGVPEADCRKALGALILTANAELMMARAGARQEGGRLETYLEATTAPDACGRELAHALAALSVGCRLCARPARALMEPQIARHYLRVRGWDDTERRGACRRSALRR